jgi:diguanylate cyclase (GGDEF)-like protein
VTDDLDDDGGNTVLGAKPIVIDEPEATPCLFVLSGNSEGRVIRVPPGTAAIGRSPTAQLRFDEAGVSRNHAQIRTDDTGRAWVADLQSSNGTFLNKQRITAEHQLRDGDTIQIGFTTVLRFLYEVLPENAVDDSAYPRDPTTGLQGTDWLVDRLAAELSLAKRRQLSLAVVVLEPMGLDALTATHGPKTADAAIGALAAKVNVARRDDAVVARYGDHKLAIILRACGAESGHGFAARIITATTPLTFMVNGADLHTKIASGVGALHDDDPGSPDLLALADAALAAGD